ncbi:pectate lyase superfamily protein-domain-containing protein [Podospora fimiseda]|uniref:Pectate lyase superfamily protein-domain-containing protein n=1 Tax=Podospora fimiseda TaxID=252190 RepID=A0AAN6YSG3_9PEZI|nr:pectate lyase superfamily protein-domain-containing protein [Podospora fimiseda]
MHLPSLGSLAAFSVLVSGVIARATVPTDYTKLAARNVSSTQTINGQYPLKHKDKDKHKPGCKSEPDYPPLSCNQFWLQNIDHQGYAPYAPWSSVPPTPPNPATYQVWRNVLDFGAVNDGSVDASVAINEAINAVNLAVRTGGTCAPGVCTGSTASPAVVYFPPGRYRIDNPIIQNYYVQLIGNPCDRPVIFAPNTYTAAFMLDSNPYGFQPDGAQSWGSTNVFWRQLANFVFDARAVPANRAEPLRAIHWPSSQATSISNVEILLSTAADTDQRGLFIENGSGGFVGDLVVNGGLYGLEVGNQQYTFRGISIFNAKTAVKQGFNWGWTYMGIKIVNCGVGFDFTAVAGDTNDLLVGSAVIIDSEIINTPIGIVYGDPVINIPPTANTFSFERIALQNVPRAIVGPGLTGPTVLAGTPTNTFIETWGRGNAYVGEDVGVNGPIQFQGAFLPVERPKALTIENGDYYTASKPYYENTPLDEIYTARQFNAVGDNTVDDTDALNNLFAAAAKDKKLVYINAGMYRVTRTVRIPPGSRIFGDPSFPQIISSGPFFQNERRPRPVVQVGWPGSKGRIEWSNTIIGTRGPQAGAILLQYHLNSPVADSSKHDKRDQAGEQGGLHSCEPSGMWDVHVRIGGFIGSDLQLAQCPKTPGNVINQFNLDRDCVAAFLSWHITESAGGLYQENNWVWVADHDVEQGVNNQQITIYAGRGLLVESSDGPNWLVASSVEHHQRYEYQFWDTKNIFAGQIQTETAYYQLNPDARLPQVAQEKWHDPRFNRGESGWALRVVDSKDIVIYGAGLYSFFINYDNSCAAPTASQKCQQMIFSVEGDSEIRVFNLNTVGVTWMLTVNGVDGGLYTQNMNRFAQTIAQFSYDEA